MAERATETTHGRDAEGSKTAAEGWLWVNQPPANSMKPWLTGPVGWGERQASRRKLGHLDASHLRQDTWAVG